MKVKSTLIFGLALLATMLAAGTATGFYSYKMGYEALKGVTQPEANPTRKLADNEGKPQPNSTFVPVNEKQIIQSVQSYIKNKGDKSKSPATEKSDDKSQPQANNPDQENEKLDSNKEQQGKFPLSVQDQGVSMEIVNATVQGGSLLLDINMKNKGDKSRQFLYSFLEVKDGQGNALSAITEGLPEELPANGESFSGAVRIPSASVSQEQKISLSLTDYPEQKLKLFIDNIPVGNYPQ